MRFTSNAFMIIHMKRSGFTLMELIIVIAIMGILLVLGVVNLRGSQVSSRDAERKSDIEALSSHLETYYTSGSDGSTTLGTYPPTTLTPSVATYYLRDIDMKSMMAPGITSPDLTFIVATNNIQTTAGVLPQPTINQYVYQPLKSDGNLCTDGGDECVKYNLYYRLEANNTVTMLTSRKQ